MASSRKPKGIAPPGQRGRLGLRHFVVLLLLLIAPSLALRRLSASVPFPWLLAYAVVISLVTYALYAADKDSAQDQTSDWRAPEKLLHLLEFAGGWPAAFLAQRQLRHKCSKFSYQFVFWLIVAVHLYAATDYQLGWRMTRTTWRHVFPTAPRPRNS